METPVNLPFPKNIPLQSSVGRKDTSAKREALRQYATDPKKCTKNQKILIFREIKSVDNRVKQSTLTVCGLMSYFSGMTEVNLTHPTCIQVVLDSFENCPKEIKSELAKWLVEQPTFHLELLKKCLKVLNQEDLLVYNYTFEYFIKFYQENNCHRVLNKDNPPLPILPLNDPLIVSTMKILIKNDFNENRIEKLVVWMMKQPEFELATFVQWAEIFHQKEKEKGGKENGLIDYSLLKKMMSFYKQNDFLEKIRSSNSNLYEYLFKFSNENMSKPK